MTETLPEPESRKESYLAKAAGMTVETLPTPASREELYLNAIAEGGGGGGTSDFNDLTNRPKYNGTAMTGETDIPVAPTVVQTTGTSETDVMSQNATTSMVFGAPQYSQKVKIGSNITLDNVGNLSYVALGERTKVSSNGIAIGQNAEAGGDAVAIGSSNFGVAGVKAYSDAVAIGAHAEANKFYSVAIGFNSKATKQGQFDISTLATTNTYGYNNSQYRLLTGLYDGQSAHDAATVGQALGETESYTIATADWSALSASSPYTYQATVTATHTIGASTVAELLNDAPVTFATYGFAIGSISGQSVTIYSIGQPSASVTLKVNYKG